MDVIPGTLSVISLNTIYFYDSNKGERRSVTPPISHHYLISWLIIVPFSLMSPYRSAVGGCEYKEPNDPGNLQLDWLNVQLGVFKEKGIKVSVAYSPSRSWPLAPGSDRTGSSACDVHCVFTSACFLGVGDGTCPPDP